MGWPVEPRAREIATEHKSFRVVDLHNVNPGEHLKALQSLISWEIWKEMNSRIVRQHESIAITVLAKIKYQVNAWIAAGAKCLASVLVREK